MILNLQPVPQLVTFSSTQVHAIRYPMAHEFRMVYTPLFGFEKAIAEQWKSEELFKYYYKSPISYFKTSHEIPISIT